MSPAREDDIQLRLQASPHIKAPDSTPRIMWSVTASLVPVVGAAVYYFGPGAILVIGAATLGSILTEWAFAPKGSLASRAPGSSRAGSVPCRSAGRFGDSG